MPEEYQYRDDDISRSAEQPLPHPVTAGTSAIETRTKHNSWNACWDLQMTVNMRRQRVGVACDKCRELKAKCDGQQPVCCRCEGYGFNCTWSTRRRRASRAGPGVTGCSFAEGRQRRRSASGGDLLPHDRLPAYSRAVESYETLIQEIRANLDNAHQAALDFSLQDIRRLVPQESMEEQVARVSAETSPQDGVVAASPPTYVGKASDIHFIHSIRQCVHGHEHLAGEDAPAQSYSQTHVSESLATLKHPLLLPPQAEADQFLDVYLSTIHIAYPFISKPVLLEAFQRFQTGDIHQPEFRPWLAMFNFIFAIGSYYTSFPHGKHSGTSHHFRYFDQGLYYSRELSADCSLMSVWILLVQCFFLLAVCHTDWCWNTLGLAIRMGQSIGFHVESSPSCTSKMSWMADRAHWRRTWYSMYVLDRLLALQLGRPMAIHEADFRVELPSTNDQSPFGPPSDERSIPNSTSGRGCVIEYFLEVIRFSHIVGQVIRGLYRPSQIDLSPDQMLHCASGLDQRLADWKANLPRHLRFDLGHTFEKSISFKRQRNMLAVKFHHLRALIHRPFLCLPLLQMNNQPFMDLLLLDKERISEAEWNCVHEAQQTAHLLHNVVDERSLVHDFPWWQMISCLICASSILFVAECFYNNNNLLDRRASAQSLREDAETCLKVFEALSVNSAAAQKAADMLEGLSRMRRSTEEVGSTRILSTLPPVSCPPSNGSSQTDTHHTSDPAPFFPSPQLPPDMSSLCDWPSEISSAMEWSVRFLDHPHFQPPELPMSTHALQ